MPPVPVTPKPRDRASAESRSANFARYVVGGFGDDATKTLGIDVNYPPVPQGVTITDFAVDSPAEAAGVSENDFILEVDGSPVGKIHGRTYEPWEHYGRSGKTTVELLISYVRDTGERGYYYPKIKATPIEGVEKYLLLPDDFFTSAKPRTRQVPENRDANIARYRFGYGNFQAFSKFELGVQIDYVGEMRPANSITNIAPASAAEEKELQVGDVILEVDGAPIGVIGDRLYEAWRQYIYTKDGTVELLIAFFDPAVGDFRYYYPQVKLKPLSSPN